MRIVSWNCAGASRDKFHEIMELKPDIAVIQECECLDGLKFQGEDKFPLKSFWFSEHDHNKGVGIFFCDEIEILSIEYYSRIEFIVPIRIKNKFDFYLFGAIIFFNLELCTPKLLRQRSYFAQIQCLQCCLLIL